MLRHIIVGTIVVVYIGFGLAMPSITNLAKQTIATETEYDEFLNAWTRAAWLGPISGFLIGATLAVVVKWTRSGDRLTQIHWIVGGVDSRETIGERTGLMVLDWIAAGFLGASIGFILGSMRVGFGNVPMAFTFLSASVGIVLVRWRMPDVRRQTANRC